MKGTKIKHLLASALLILPLALSGITGTASAVQAADGDGNAHIALHKVSFDKGSLPDGFDTDSVFNNDGAAVDVTSKGGTLLNGVQFTAYDITGGYEATNGSTDERKKTVQADADTFAKNGTKVGDPVTTSGEGDAAGTANFTLPEKSSVKATDGKYAVYLIKETKSETDSTNPSVTVTKVATPIVLVMPLDNMGTADSPLNIYPKNQTETTFTKDLQDSSKTHLDATGNNAALGLGDTASYVVTAVVPSDIANLDAYKITDTPDAGLNIDSSTVKISDPSNADFDFSIATVAGTPATTNAGAGFTIEFSKDDFAEKLATIKGDHLQITYTATINTLLIPGDKFLNNKVQLNNEPNTTTSTHGITTGGAQFIKEDANNTKKKLAGAQFIVTNADHTQYLIKTGTEKTDLKYDWKDMPSDYTPGDTPSDTEFADAVILTSNSDGRFAITGLDYGKYNLAEIGAPDGYALKQDYQSFDVSETSYNTDKAITIDDAPKGLLPSTGGMGIYIVIAAGLALVALGFAFLRRGKHHEEV